MLFDTPIPFQEALAVARDRGLLPTRMSSEELRQLESAVKRRAVFSARLDRASVLQVIKDEVAQIVGGDVDGAGRLRSIPEAKARIREALFRAGVPLADSDTPALQDFYSDARRQLIVKTQVLDTLNHGRWVADQDEDLLDAAPAWELVRVVEPLTRGRDWPTRWDAALRATTSAGATSALSGRMVALKNHPVWQALGDGAGGYKDTLGNPWPPFAFNSGMNVVDVLRDEAESLGILRPGQRVRPETLEDAPPELSASLNRFDPALRAALAADPALRVQGNTVAAANTVTQAFLPVAEQRSERLGILANAMAFKRDSLGRFDGDGQVLTPKMNIKRGSKAADRALRQKKDVQNAMQVEGLGSIDFEWGRPGTPKLNEKGTSHADGYGISHIHAKRGTKAVLMIPRVLAKGKIVAHPTNPKKRLVTHQGWTVVVEKRNSRKSYVVSSIDSENPAQKTTPRSANEGSTTQVACGPEIPHPTRSGLKRTDPDAVAAKESLIARFRAAWNYKLKVTA